MSARAGAGADHGQQDGENARLGHMRERIAQVEQTSWRGTYVQPDRMLTLDLRHALRLFRREPGFAAAAVLTLALGIGANTALFAVVEAVLLRPLPYPDADELVLVKHRDIRTGLTKPDIAIGDFVDLRARQQSFEPLAGYGGFQATLVGAGEPVRVEGVQRHAANAFDVLGAAAGDGPARSQPADVREGAAPVVIVSHELWRTQLGSDPPILSRSIQLGTTRRLVVGVAPPGFHFPPPDAHRRDRAGRGARRTAPAERAGRAGSTGSAGSQPGVPLDARRGGARRRSPQQFEREFPQQNQGSRYFTHDAARRAGRRHQAAAAAAARGGRLRAAHRLRQRRQPAAGAVAGAAAGAGDAPGARRRTVAAGGADAHRRPGAGAGRRPGRRAGRVARRAGAGLADAAGRADIPGLDRVGLNPWVLAFSLAASLVVGAGLQRRRLPRPDARATARARCAGSGA